MSHIDVPDVQGDRKRVWDRSGPLEPLFRSWVLGEGGLGMAGPVVWAERNVGPRGILVQVWHSRVFGWVEEEVVSEGHWNCPGRDQLPWGLVGQVGKA